MNKFLLIILLQIFFVSSLAMASDNDSSGSDAEELKGIDKNIFIATAGEDRVLRIGLVDCIAYALKNNSAIMIERIEPKLSQDDVKIARSAFEPALNVNYTLADSTRESAFTIYPDIARGRSGNLTVGVAGKLVTGTEYNIEFLGERYKGNSTPQRMSPFYTAGPRITITQPLFRDFGIAVNRADIMIAQNDFLISNEKFKKVVIDIITRTKASYFGYSFFLKNYDIAQLSLQRAKKLLEINQARYRKGLVSSVDLLETESTAALREKEVISSFAVLKQAEDRLKLITNLVNDPEVWNARLELIDRPQFNVQSTDLAESLRIAFRRRPDYHAARTDLRNRDIRIEVADNALLPTVDLIGSFGLNGLGDDYGDSLNNIDWDYQDWTVGVSFNLPWGGGDRARDNQRKQELVQALIAFKQLEQEIILDVRDKVREVDIQYRQVLASNLFYEKETQNYQAQKERYAAGEVSTHDMLDYQDQLSLAERDYVKSLIDYNIALITLEQSEGVTLVKNNIKLAEDLPDGGNDR